MARQPVGKSPAWRASIDGEWQAGAALERAGSALVRLAQALPLLRKARGGVVEFLRATAITGEFFVSVESLPPEGAHVRMLVRAVDAVDFAASRQWHGRARSPWDAARRARLVRRDFRDRPCVIEPGAAWFVAWLESAGAQTIFSCEGHPNDFHITFRGPYALAHRIAGVPLAAVEIFRSGAFPQQGQWQLRLDQVPGDRADRDNLLTRLADGLAKLCTSEPAGWTIPKSRSRSSTS